MEPDDALDFDTDDFGCYHERLKKLEGANVFRIRWYGGKMPEDSSPLPVPTSELMFLERKTHHEDWVQLDSVKERFQIRRNRIPKFCTGELDIEGEIRSLVETGKLKEKEFEGSLQLAQEIQHTFLQRELKPRVRTVYHRTAFQRSDTNEVRMSLDYPCYFVKQDAQYQSLDDKTKFWDHLEVVPSMEQTEFPWGIVELKIADPDNQPPWVEDLLSTGWLIPADKFSKFQHSVVTFFPEKLHLFPYWIDYVQKHEEYEDDIWIDCVQKREESEGDIRELTAIDIDDFDESNFKSGLVCKPNGESRLLSIVQTSRQDDTIPAPEKPSKSQKDDRNFSPAGDGVLTVAKGEKGASSIVQRFSSRTRGDRKVKSPSSSVVIKPPSAVNRTKIEPKTFFANERTFIQWLGASLLLVTLSIALQQFGKRGEIVGFIFFPVAVLFIVYSTAIFYWRLRKIIARDPSRYDDPYGPAVLAVVLIGAMISAVAIAATEKTDETSSLPSEAGPSIQTRRSHFEDEYSSHCSPLPLPSIPPFAKGLFLNTFQQLLLGMPGAVFATRLNNASDEHMPIGGLLDVVGIDEDIILTTRSGPQLRRITSAEIVCRLEDQLHLQPLEQINGLVRYRNSHIFALNIPQKNVSQLVFLDSNCKVSNALTLAVSADIIDITVVDDNILAMCSNGDLLKFPINKVSTVKVFKLADLVVDVSTWHGLTHYHTRGASTILAAGDEHIYQFEISESHIACC